MEIYKLTNVAEVLHGVYNIELEDGRPIRSVQEGNIKYWPSVQAHIDAGGEVAEYVAPVPTYAEQRATEYPKIGDQLDAIWKQLNTDRLNGKDLISEADSLLGSVLAVKAKYPKGE
jgi:hypothetical protein